MSEVIGSVTRLHRAPAPDPLDDDRARAAQLSHEAADVELLCDRVLGPRDADEYGAPLVDRVAKALERAREEGQR